MIIVDEIPVTGLAEGIFANNIKVMGNCSYKINLSSGWIHDGNTVQLFDTNLKLIATYTICTKDTMKNYYKEDDSNDNLNNNSNNNSDDSNVNNGTDNSTNNSTNDNGNETDANPQTADSQNIWMLVICMIVSGSYFIVKKKVKEKIS